MSDGITDGIRAAERWEREQKIKRIYEDNEGVGYP